MALALALPLAGAWNAPGAPMEEGKLLTAAELVLDGRLPHRDFEHLYAPGDVYGVAAAFALTSASVAVERAVGVFFTALLVASVFALGMQLSRSVAAAVVAALICGAALLPFGVHAYSWTAGLGLATAAAACMTAAVPAERGRRRELAAAAGLLTGLALFYRADLVLALGIAGMAFLTVATPRMRTGWLAGLGAGLVPLLAHAAVVGPARVVDGMLRDPLVRLRSGRSLPAPPPADHLAGWLEAIAAEPSPLSYWPNPGRALQLRLAFLLTAAAAVVLVGMGAFAWRRHGRSLGAVVLIPGLLAVGISPQMIQRADTVHVRFVACVAVALVPVAVAGVIGRRRAVAGAVAGVAVAATFSLAAPQLAFRELAGIARMARDPAPAATHEGRRFPVHDAVLAAEVEAAVAAAKQAAGEGGRAFVGAHDLRLAAYGDSFLYHLLLPDVRPASYFLELNPGTVNRAGSGLADDLARADVVVRSWRYVEWDEPNASTDLGDPAAARVLDRRFRTVGRFGPFEVLSAH